MAWLALPLLFLLPGYLVLAAWRRSRDLDFWESLFLVPFTSILLSSWLGLVLAEIGLFSLVTLSILLLLFVLVLLILARRRLCLDCFARPSLNLTSLLLLIILALAGWAFSRPAEVISGTFDPGIYLSTGANIAHTGSIAYSDPFLAQLGDNLRPFLLERRGEIGVGAVRLPAFWMPQAQGDTVIPAFLHLYPVWLAILYSLGGIQAALFVSPIFGLMGVWALFLLGRRLAGTRVALLAAALLALNPAQIWFARYPISEVTVQMLLLGGLTLWVLMEERRSRLLALLGGASLGLAHLAKVDQVFLPVALFLTLFLIWVFKGLERRHLFFLVTYGVLLAQAILHVYFFSFAYTWINLNPFLSFLTSRLAIAFYLGGVLALIAAALARSRLAILREWLTVHRGALSVGLAGVVGLLAVYGYFLWPLSSDPAQSSFLSSDGVTPVYLRLYREEGLVRLGWYLSPLGLLLGLAGFVRFAGTKLDRRSWPLLILFVTQLILYLLTAGMAYPVHFWASRRYVPLVIPALLFFASLSLASLRPSLRLDPRRWLVYLVPAALTLALLVSSVQTSARFLWQTEYQGALEGLERLSSRMENPALVFFQPRTEGNIFSAPLQNLFGKTAFVLQQEPQESFFSQGVERWLADGWKVYLVLTDKYPEYLSGDLTYSLVDDNGLAIRAMEQSFDHLPRETLPMSFPLRLYRLLPASGYPYRLDMGSLRIENSLRLRLPQPAGSGLRLSFRARTAGAEALLLSTSMDGKLQQRSLVEPETHLYQFDMPVQGTSNDGYHEITLSVDPPGAEKGGIMLEWFEAVDSQGS